MADIDNDGDLDLIVGEGLINHRLHFFENIGPEPSDGFIAWQEENLKNVPAGLTTPGMMIELEVDAIIHDEDGTIDYS